MQKSLNLKFIGSDFSVANLDDSLWHESDAVICDQLWSGKSAPINRTFEARPLWSSTGFYLRFDAAQHEPLGISERPNIKTKTIGLWNYDVCEIFIAPNTKEKDRYFEFEVAPTGEWVDLAIEIVDGERKTDFEYTSGMECAARIEDDRVVMAMKIPWEAFGKKPAVGDVWLGNLFRCVGSGEERGYLAWRPTMTEKPNFHVPEAFGEFRFVE